MESSRDEKESIDFQQDFAQLFAIIQALPTLDDGAWKDLFDMSKNFYRGRAARDIKIEAHDPVARVFHLLNANSALLDAAKESQQSPLEYLPTNQIELLKIKQKVGQLRDIIYQSLYGKLTKEPDGSKRLYELTKESHGLERLYLLVCEKLGLRADKEKESKYAGAPTVQADATKHVEARIEPLFTIDPKEVEKFRNKFETHTLAKSVLNLYAVTNALDSGNIFGAIDALAQLGDRLQHKYGEKADYITAMHALDIPAQIPTSTGLILLSSIRQACENLKSVSVTDEMAQTQSHLFIGLSAWTSMLAPNIKLPKAEAKSIEQAEMMMTSPEVRPDKVTRSLYRLEQNCREYKKYLEDEIQIRLSSIYASSRLAEDVYDLVGVAGSGGKETAAEVILKHWDEPKKASYLERYLKTDKSFGLIVEKYRRISELNTTLEKKQKPLEKSAEFVDKFLRFKPVFEKRPDEGWRKVAKAISAAVAILASIPTIGLSY